MSTVTLTDAQREQVAAATLRASHRDRFLQDLAVLLARSDPVEDAAVERAIAETLGIVRVASPLD